jgi:hypothetical protein
LATKRSLPAATIACGWSNPNAAPLTVATWSPPRRRGQGRPRPGPQAPRKDGRVRALGRVRPFGGDPPASNASRRAQEPQR